MSSTDILKLIEDKNVKFVDLRFTDTRGKEQHVTVPSHAVDEGFLEGGKMFDGSSIAGWKGINDSDMILMPDASTAVLDIFTEEATLNLRCDVVEPLTMQGYDRCPRSLAKRAQEYMRSTGIADEAYFGPENEFFVFGGTQECDLYFWWHFGKTGLGRSTTMIMARMPAKINDWPILGY